MSCAINRAILPTGTGVQVNGVAIRRDLIAREVQHHPSKTPADGWSAAARALVVRELLLQEAQRMGVVGKPATDSDGSRESDDVATIRTLIEQEVVTPEPDPAMCRRYYDHNRRRFRSADIYECAHILCAAPASDTQAYAHARVVAEALIGQLREEPELFPQLAQAHSACPSAVQGGHLGQITRGEITPEFAQALAKLAPGMITQEPVPARYGFHVIRLDRRIAGDELPFATVADRIAAYLKDSVERRAIAQYVARLASRASIEGVALAGTDALRVH